MKHLFTNYVLPFAFFIGLITVWIAFMLYVTWGGDCYHRDIAEGRNTIEEQNRCLNPRNW